MRRNLLSHVSPHALRRLTLNRLTPPALRKIGGLFHARRVAPVRAFFVSIKGDKP